MREVLDRPLSEPGALRDEIGVVVGVGADHIIVLNEDFETREIPRSMVRPLNLLEVMARMANND